mmetsp:Transcript_15282/g.22118  ORF Transcript_15282/g.22118 Transcript_15282/m.22118 type:complete len:95 (+) Transcript_15282:416-700(+)
MFNKTRLGLVFFFSCLGNGAKGKRRITTNQPFMMTFSTLLSLYSTLSLLYSFSLTHNLGAYVLVVATIVTTAIVSFTAGLYTYIYAEREGRLFD